MLNKINPIILGNYRVYTRQCLANASATAAGPTVSTAGRRAKHENEQEDQEKSDLQGKIQFYQKLCASQQQAIVERRNATTKINNISQNIRQNTAGTSTSACRFSTFKSVPGQKTTIDPESLDLAGISIGQRELCRNRGEFRSGRSRDYYQSIGRLPEQSPNTETHRMDKQSYFFHGHKTQKNVDRIISTVNEKLIDNAESNINQTTTTTTTLVDLTTDITHVNNLFSCKENEQKINCQPSSIARNLLDYDEINVEFTEHEGEIFKKSSIELLQATVNTKKNSLSFRSKSKTHRSLESLERSIDYTALDAKSLDHFPYESPKLFYTHTKQRSLDSTQKSKKSPNSADKRNKRPSFLQRVGRSLHFLPRDKGQRPEQLLKRDEQLDGAHCSQDRNEYFLRKNPKNCDFFDKQVPDTKSDFFDKFGTKLDTLKCQQKFNNDDYDDESKKFETKDDNISDTHETTSGNKDSLEIGYSISQLGRLYLQNLQNQTEGLRATELVDEKNYLDWIARGDLDMLSHVESFRVKPQGNLDILKGILLDLFVCICI